MKFKIQNKECLSVHILNKLHLLRPTQNKFIVIAPYVHTTCFGHFSFHRQACQYKNRVKEDTVK